MSQIIKRFSEEMNNSTYIDMAKTRSRASAKLGIKILISCNKQIMAEG